jgi:AcrR family transcriptional regulator
MAARRYQLGQRQAAAEQTRQRILTAARDLLAASGGLGGFTIDAVAGQAGVARMTVYYQFGSKVGLLEALCDFLAVRGGIMQLGEAFCQPDALDALAALVGVFGRFWASDRLVTRRLHGLATLDPDIERVIGERQGRRREGLRHIAGRLREQHGRPGAAEFDEAVDVLMALTSFETFDVLAGPERSPEEVAPLVNRLARAALGLTPPAQGARIP